MNNSHDNTARQAILNKSIRKLWEQHIMWTRQFIISTAEDIDDLDLVTKRLLRNPFDFANLLSRFYNSKISHNFQVLFTEHLTIAADLVTAAKNGNSEDILKYRDQWYHNADEIATFLASINPYWRFKDWKYLLYEHLKMTEMEVSYRLHKQYEEDIKIYDKSENEALRMADYMTNGLIKQFMMHSKNS